MSATVETHHTCHCGFCGAPPAFRAIQGGHPRATWIEVCAACVDNAANLAVIHDILAPRGAYVIEPFVGCVR